MSSFQQVKIKTTKLLTLDKSLKRYLSFTPEWFDAKFLMLLAGWLQRLGLSCVQVYKFIS